ncbi:MAG: YfcE family phosphodiesterase [Thermoleophilia bacterium]|nr:YfcE family phosphodiesterase [Thermoleophilia bacterium]
MREATDIGGRTARVGVVCDTHVGDVLPSLPDEVCAALAGVDLIIHAGDVTSRGVIDRLEAIAPVVAVRGNHDRLLDDLPEDVVVTVAGVRIGVTHGRRNRAAEVCSVFAGLVIGRPVTLGLARALRRRVGRVDCLVFGHYHLPFHQRVGGTDVVSPGALYVIDADPTAVFSGLRALAFRRFRSGLPAEARVPAIGILHIEDRRIRLQRIPLSGPLRSGSASATPYRMPSTPGK